MKRILISAVIGFLLLGLISGPALAQSCCEDGGSGGDSIWSILIPLIFVGSIIGLVILLVFIRKYFGPKKEE